jgi:hypothetical protein
MRWIFFRLPEPRFHPKASNLSDSDVTNLHIHCQQQKEANCRSYNPPARLAQLFLRCAPVLLLCHTRLLEVSHNMILNFTTVSKSFCQKSVFNTRHSKSSVRHNALKFTMWKYHTLTNTYFSTAVPRKGINSKRSSVTRKSDVQTQISTVKWAASLSSAFFRYYRVGSKNSITRS